MKKLIFTLVLLLGVVSNTFAQKEFLRVRHYIGRNAGGSYSDIKLSGNIPSELKSYYTYSDNNLIDVLNTLSELGYSLENVSTKVHSFQSTSYYEDNEIYLFSKPKGSVDTNAKGFKVESYDDADVHEVARYNLQGMPVDTTEKGIQIVVYSNYTTKTVIVE